MELWGFLQFHALVYAYDEIALGRQNRMLVVGGEDLAH